VPKQESALAWDYAIGGINPCAKLIIRRTTLHDLWTNWFCFAKIWLLKNVAKDKWMQWMNWLFECTNGPSERMNGKMGKMTTGLL